MISLKKLVVGSSASIIGATTLVAATIALASPAQASVWDCQQYLRDRGYVVGEKVTNACQGAAANDNVQGQIVCIASLRKIDVKYRHADIACELAPK